MTGRDLARQGDRAEGDGEDMREVWARPARAARLRRVARDFQTSGRREIRGGSKKDGHPGGSDREGALGEGQVQIGFREEGYASFFFGARRGFEGLVALTFASGASLEPLASAAFPASLTFASGAFPA